MSETQQAIYPWQARVWQRLMAMRGQWPHAILLHGPAGTGKFALSIQLSKALLCRSSSEQGYACDVCESCGWFKLGNHPDYRLLTPEQDGGNDEDSAVAAPKKTGKKSQISVTQVRELGGFLSLSSHHGGGIRIILIHPAEALNPASANALLKMLEEPPPGVIFILVSNQPQRLLPTIMSRCQKIDMAMPAQAVALQWLQQQGVSAAEQHLAYAGGSPLAALLLAGESGKSSQVHLQQLAAGAKANPLLTAAALLSQGMEAAISSLQKWIYDLVSMRLTNELRYHYQYKSALQALAVSVDLDQLLDYQRKLDAARKSASHPLNNELQLEALILQYTQAFKTDAVSGKQRGQAARPV